MQLRGTPRRQKENPQESCYLPDKGVEGGQEGELHINTANSSTPTPPPTLPSVGQRSASTSLSPATPQPCGQRQGAWGGGGWSGVGPAIVSPPVLSAAHFHQFSQAVPPRLVQTHTLPPGCLPITAPSLKINPSLCTTCLSLLPSLLSLPRGDSSANPVASPRIQTQEGKGRGSPCPHRWPPRWPFLGFLYKEAARLSRRPRFSHTLPSETRTKPLRLRLPRD